MIIINTQIKDNINNKHSMKRITNGKTLNENIFTKKLKLKLNPRKCYKGKEERATDYVNKVA